MANSPHPILPSLNELSWQQGSPSDLTHDLQLMLLIQPNCPGCHIHALPLANQIASSPNRFFDIYCVSTAFEDFDFNNPDTARLLLEGKHVGVSKERLGEEVRHVPTMPLAHDIITPLSKASAALKDLALESIKASARQQMAGRLPSDVLERQLARVGYDMLPAQIATLFSTVQAMGTPTWVLHRKNGQVLSVRLGEEITSEAGLLEWIERSQRG